MTAPGPSASPYAFFSSQPDLNLLTQVNETLPGSAGGIVEAVKRAVVGALREGAQRTSLKVDGKAPYIDLEYPLKQTQYPGVWVQFSITRLARAGLDQEVPYLDPNTNTWTPIQTWTYDGQVTMSIVALKNKDRDQLADAVTTMLMFSRPPETWATKPDQDTKQYRDFITSLNDNAYVSITPQLDIITSNRQGTDVGVPWAPDVLAYTDNYSFDVHGQTQMKFENDGAYTLSSVQLNPTMASTIPEGYQPPPPVLPPIGQGVGLGVTYRTQPGPPWSARGA